MRTRQKLLATWRLVRHGTPLPGLVLLALFPALLDLALLFPDSQTRRTAPDALDALVDMSPPAPRPMDTKPAQAVVEKSGGPGSTEAPAPAVAVAPNGGLKIASWNLAGATAFARPAKPAEERASWRTSFGSERQTEIRSGAEAGKPDGAVDADAVLLQGVSDPSLLRRLFPAKQWVLVVARRGGADDGDGGAPNGASSTADLTAIAIRVWKGMRITAREFALRLDSVETAEPSAARIEGTAARVAYRGQTLWLASIASPAACDAATGPCVAEAQLEGWRSAKLSQGAATVVGGKLPDRGAAPIATECSDQSLRTELPMRALPVLSGENLAGVHSGCAVIIELGRRE